MDFFLSHIFCMQVMTVGGSSGEWFYKSQILLVLMTVGGSSGEWFYKSQIGLVLLGS